MGEAELVLGVFPGLTINYSNPSELALWGGEYESETRGIWFIGDVETPSVFNSQGSGYWNWTQVVTSMNIWYKETTGDYYDYNGNFTSGPLILPRLDTAYPYAGPYFAYGATFETEDTPGE